MGDRTLLPDNLRRPVFGIERIWLAADRITPPFVNQWVVEGDGGLDLDAWPDAVGRAAEVHPLLSARLRGVLRGLRWEAGGAPPRVTVHEGAWDATGPDGAPWCATRLPPAGGPVAEVVLLPGPTPRVVFRTHHAIADGRGTLLWAAEVGRALRGEPLLGSAGAADDVGLARAVGASSAVDPPKVLRSPLGPGPAQPLRQVTWARRRIRGRFDRLLARVTLALDAFSDAPLRIGVPVDLRPRAPGLRTTANLTGLSHVDVPPGAPLETVHALIGEATAPARAAGSLLRADAIRGLPLWLMSWVGWGSTRRCLTRNEYSASAVVSNLGRLDLDIVAGAGFLPRRSFWIPPGHPGLPLFVALSGDRRGVDLTVSAPLALTSQAHLADVLGELAALLTD